MGDKGERAEWVESYTHPGPIEGQSHWCDEDVAAVPRGRISDVWGNASKSTRSCLNVVRNDSDHCAAGHKNKLRLAGVTSIDGINWPVHDPAWDSYEVGDLTVALRPAAKEPSREELVQTIISANREFQNRSHEAERWVSLDDDPLTSDDYLTAKDAQRRLFEAAMQLSELQSKSATEAQLRIPRILRSLRGYFKYAPQVDERMAAVSDESFVAAVLEELGTDSFWRKVTMEEMDKILCRAEEIERDKP